MKKRGLYIIWHILNILHKILLVIGGLVAGGFATLSVMAFILIIIGFILSLPLKDMIGIMVVTFVIKITILIILFLLQLGLDKLYLKIKKLP